MSTGLPEYTDIDRRRTRVYRRETDANRTLVPDEAPGIGGTQPIALKKEGLFDGLSVAQVLAGAGAAATSVLLASKIGVYGSVIGAAVSSVVTVLATQVYRKALTAGAKKLSSGVLEGESRVGARPKEGLGAEGALGAASYANGTHGARLAPTKLQARAAAQRAAVQRKVVVASAVVAVAAVALCAGGVLLATAGEGLGDRAPALFGAADDTAEVQDTNGAAPVPNGMGPVGDANGNGAGQADNASSDSGTTSSSSTGAGTSNDSSTGTAAGAGASSSGTSSSTGNTGDSSSSDSATGAGTDSSSSDSANSGTATDQPKTDSSPAATTGTASAS